MHDMIEIASALQGALAKLDVNSPLKIVIAYEDIPSFIGHLQRAGVSVSFGAAKRAAIHGSGFFKIIFYGVTFALDFTQFERIAPPLPVPVKPRPVAENMRL